MWIDYTSIDIQNEDANHARAGDREALGCIPKAVLGRSEALDKQSCSVRAGLCRRSVSL